MLGGFLAAAGFLIGFTVPEAARPHLAHLPAPASGPLLAAEDHPEWKQFLILAALRRATELGRLRELPDSPPLTAPANGAVATLPATRSDAEPEDLTGSITTAPETVVPIEIGETSSTELPVGPPQTLPPVQKPETLKPVNESVRQPVRKQRRARFKPKPAKPAQAASNPFSALFGSITPAPSTTTP